MSPATPERSQQAVLYLLAANNLHYALTQEGGKEEALECLRDSIAVHRRHFPPGPGHPADTLELANHLTQLGETLENLGRRADAIPPLAEAVDLYTPLTRGPNPQPQATPGLQKVLEVRARVLERLGRNAEAEADRKLLSSVKGKP